MSEFVIHGSKVQELRRKNGWSRQKMAQLMGISVSTMLTIEGQHEIRHKYRPAINALFRGETLIDTVGNAGLTAHATGPRDTALSLYNRIVADAAALYKIAKAVRNEPAVPTLVAVDDDSEEVRRAGQEEAAIEARRLGQPYDPSHMPSLYAHDNPWGAENWANFIKGNLP